MNPPGNRRPASRHKTTLRERRNASLMSFLIYRQSIIGLGRRKQAARSL